MSEEKTGYEVATTEHTQAITAANLIEMATKQGAGIEVIERMAALYERERADQRRQAYITALANFQASVPAIVRDDKAHNNRYAKLDRIVNTIKQTLRDCGLAYHYEIDDSGDAIAVTCVITHAGGHSERTTMRGKPDTSGAKNAIQAAGSTVTYMQRYTLCGALGLVTVDEDNDGGAPGEPITKQQRLKLLKLIAESGVDLDKMLAWAGVAQIDDLPMAKFAEAVRTCNRHSQQKGNA